MKTSSHNSPQPPPSWLTTIVGKATAAALWIILRLNGGGYATKDGLSELHVPYYNTQGSVLGTRVLRTVDGDSDVPVNWFWKGKAADVPYGIWHRTGWNLRKPVFILPSELDAALAWSLGFQAVSPGADRIWQATWDTFLDGVDHVVFLGNDFPEWLTTSDLREHAALAPSTAGDLLSMASRYDGDLKSHLRSELKNLRPWQVDMDSVGEQSVERAQVDAGSLLRSGNLLDDLAKVLLGTGFAGDIDHVKLIYLAFTSRLLDRPVSLAIKGSSAAGKSYAVDRVTKLMPEAAYLKMTGMSPASLYYSNATFAHRVLLINEADGIDSRKLAYTLRSLLTEGELQLHTTRPKRGGGREGVVIKKEGPVAVITTTTGIKLHAETETRLFSLTVADDADTTARMIAAVDTPIPEKVVRLWKALQECIAHNAAPVHIPYLGALLGKIPPVSLRLRRDKNLLIGLIKSHALLHVHKRSRDDEGSIVAIWADYEAVRHLLNPILSEMVEMTVSPQTSETVNAVIEIMEESETRNGVSITELADALGLDKSTVSRRVKRCVEDGYLVNGAGGRGRRALLFPGDPLPTGRTILPSKRSIQEG